MDSREMQQWWDAMKQAGRPVARGELADAVTDATEDDPCETCGKTVYWPTDGCEECLERESDKDRPGWLDDPFDTHAELRDEARMDDDA